MIKISHIFQSIKIQSTPKYHHLNVSIISSIDFPFVSGNLKNSINPNTDTNIADTRKVNGPSALAMAGNVQEVTKELNQLTMTPIEAKYGQNCDELDQIMRKT